MEPITVIIETPKGSGLKYDYEPKLKCFKLNKVLPAGMVFPFDFGFIPGTIGGDGDPLDVIVLSEIATFAGCCMDCRIIGAMKANQTERDGSTMRNDRYLAVPEVSELFKEVRSLLQLPGDIVDQLESFFKNYNELAGKKFEVIERVEAKEAYLMIKK
ncbi:inorganic diphosphatase [Mucilaginibacter phyllosphaerae]|uniref:inorganic diphosphatase n=1 Tax=Mucilaginibacter phyllosphaerae TaxID=1812349 RepID=A0A4Y8AKC4_9SPHI|nr:inorganic diphosphatase [Mucilaginibacter phyllosphaerae]MBB3967999.1 inorganic pyrophosphatase [Mucilaginibacter phyllosphaerae]TEW68975.1 inorganic diphosphatase [Mucilaginibacter phyllosphaerae]GGH01919.1 inorganic pyrophosphatase [Mucilaginibacter phyllosphaerae]